MPTEKEFEGKKWVLATDLEEAVSRQGEITRKRTEAETRAATAERELETVKAKAATADGAAAEITDLRAKLAAADARYERHTAIGALGITDPDVIESIEWAYERANAKLPKKDQLSLADTLEAWAADPTKAPSSVRHNFEGTAAPPPAAGAEGAKPGDVTPDPTKPAPVAGRPPPPKPKPTAAKPGPQGKPLTLEEIYAADDKQLEQLTKQFHGQPVE